MLALPSYSDSGCTLNRNVMVTPQRPDLNDDVTLEQFRNKAQMNLRADVFMALEFSEQDDISSSSSSSHRHPLL